MQIAVLILAVVVLSFAGLCLFNYLKWLPEAGKREWALAVRLLAVLALAGLGVTAHGPEVAVVLGAWFVVETMIYARPDKSLDTPLFKWMARRRRDEEEVIRSLESQAAEAVNKGDFRLAVHLLGETEKYRRTIREYHQT